MPCGNFGASRSPPPQIRHRLPCSVTYRSRNGWKIPPRSRSRSMTPWIHVRIVAGIGERACPVFACTASVANPTRSVPLVLGDQHLGDRGTGRLERAAESRPHACFENGVEAEPLAPAPRELPPRRRSRATPTRRPDPPSQRRSGGTSEKTSSSGPVTLVGVGENDLGDLGVAGHGPSSGAHRTAWRGG